MNVLIACEYSATVRDAFRSRGHNAWSCDILPTEGDPRYHYQKDVLEVLTVQPWDLMISHPPCTYLANSGVIHLHENVTSKNVKRAAVSGRDRVIAMQVAGRFFNQLQNVKIHRIAIENPIPHKYAREFTGNYSQIIQPWQFGHMETKATCLWLKNLPLLIHTDVIRPPKNMTPEEKRSWHKIHYASPGADRGKKRSKFFSGIANAMADQWGAL